MSMEYGSASRFITVVDEIAHLSITLNGAAAVDHDAYTTYTDLGQAADSCSATVKQEQ
jgi:hypothetical protein